MLKAGEKDVGFKIDLSFTLCMASFIKEKKGKSGRLCNPLNTGRISDAVTITTVQTKQKYIMKSQTARFH